MNRRYLILFVVIIIVILVISVGKSKFSTSPLFPKEVLTRAPGCGGTGRGCGGFSIVVALPGAATAAVWRTSLPEK